MKVKIKDTGEIVNVKFSVHPNPSVDETYWWCEEKKESYHKHELDFLDDDMVNEPINWKQRRYEIAKEAMNGILAGPIVDGVNPNPSVEDVAELSVNIADALIKKLKEVE